MTPLGTIGGLAHLTYLRHQGRGSLRGPDVIECTNKGGFGPIHVWNLR
jgi:hypothetical protein